MRVEHALVEPDSVGDRDNAELQALLDRSQVDFEIEFFELVVARSPKFFDALVCLGDLLSKKGLAQRALDVDLKLSRLRPKDASVFYNLACSHAVLGQEGAALAALERAVRLGFRGFEHMLGDPDLSGLRDHPRFVALVARMSIATPERVA